MISATAPLKLSEIWAVMSGPEYLTLAHIARALHRRAGEVRVGLEMMIALGAVQRQKSQVPRLIVYRTVPGFVLVDALVSRAPKPRQAATSVENRSHTPLRLSKIDGTETRRPIEDIRREEQLVVELGASYFHRAVALVEEAIKTNAGVTRALSAVHARALRYAADAIDARLARGAAT